MTWTADNPRAYFRLRLLGLYVHKIQYELCLVVIDHDEVGIRALRNLIIELHLDIDGGLL